MEWERAKGSLNAILASFCDWDFHFPVSRNSKDVSYAELTKMVEKFVKEFGEAAALD